MGCKDVILPKPLLSKGTINCFTYEESTRQLYNDILCFFRALLLHLHGIRRLEERNSKIFNLFIIKKDGLSANQFQGVHMTDIPNVDDRLTLNILLFDKKCFG